MNYYETLYIVHPALDAGRLKDIIMGIENSLKKMGGDSLAVELWGKRKLAYFIDKQKYGTYVLIQYNGEGKCTNDFAIELEHNPNILAYLTTSIEKEKVIEQEEDLETQIAGKTREAEISEARKGKETTIAETENKESDTTEIKKEDEPSDDKSIKTDAAAKEKDADSTENEDKENNSTEDESTEETNDSEGDKNVDSSVEEKSDVQIIDEVSSDEIAENEENTTDDEASGEKESETNQEKAEDKPAAVSEKEK